MKSSSNPWTQLSESRRQVQGGSAADELGSEYPERAAAADILRMSGFDKDQEEWYRAKAPLRVVGLYFL